MMRCAGVDRAGAIWTFVVAIAIFIRRRVRNSAAPSQSYKNLRANFSGFTFSRAVHFLEVRRRLAPREPLRYRNRTYGCTDDHSNRIQPFRAPELARGSGHPDHRNVDLLHVTAASWDARHADADRHPAPRYLVRGRPPGTIRNGGVAFRHIASLRGDRPYRTVSAGNPPRARSFRAESFLNAFLVEQPCLIVR